MKDAKHTERFALASSARCLNSLIVSLNVEAVRYCFSTFFFFRPRSFRSLKTDVK